MTAAEPARALTSGITPSFYTDIGIFSVLYRCRYKSGMPGIRTPNDLAGLLRGRRLQLGESQAEFARRIGRTQSWVSEAERGSVTNVYIGTMLEVLTPAGFRLEVSAGDAPSAAPSNTDDGDLALDLDDPGFSP